MKLLRNAALAMSMILGVSSTCALEGQLGILDLTANGGTNPATGNPWAKGDTYRLVFTTSAGTAATSSDIDYYNTFVQDLADASPLGIGAAEGVTWKVIGSTTSITANANASLDPAGTGISVWLVDGTTCVADDYVDLFGFRTLNSAINKSETGGAPFDGGNYWSVWTGTSTTGGAYANRELGAAGGQSSVGLVTTSDRHWIYRFNNVGNTAVYPLYAISQVLTVTGPPVGASVVYR